MGRWYLQCAGNFPCGLSKAKEITHSRGGHKWFASFNSIKHVKSWYPYCLNKHENLYHEVITNILGLPFSICRPDFLKIPEHPQGLELDIYSHL
ncbi:hypothetical protein RclHR1_03300027 [Rhizophagus clarus]|uniref:Uncharacterized protein n=1 Tax=Rhizophagus clarus TaxID=94130 RepID=A0A2Z6R8S0_9GLOM|nr:hypothetical protein RclHR1_03300027 [Rhizophagus clarus]